MSVRRADPNAYVLASNLSASGTAVKIPGGDYMFFVEGTVGGATISLQMKSPNGTAMDVQGQSGLVVIKSTALPFTATPIELPPGDVLMAVTGGAPSGLYAYLVGLD